MVNNKLVSARRAWCRTRFKGQNDYFIKIAGMRYCIQVFMVVKADNVIRNLLTAGRSENVKLKSSWAKLGYDHRGKGVSIQQLKRLIRHYDSVQNPTYEQWSKTFTK